MGSGFPCGLRPTGGLVRPANRYLLRLVSIAPWAIADLAAIRREASSWFSAADGPPGIAGPVDSTVGHGSFLDTRPICRSLGDFLLLPGRFRVGRRATCDIRLACPSVSREHLEIEVLPERGALVRDLGSTNGSWLDDRPLHAAAIEGPVMLALGPLKFRLGPVP